jgi:hypothetical protein
MRRSRLAWSSPVVMARRSSPAISIAASTAGLPRPGCPRSPGIAPGRHAVHCWRRWRCIRVWRCRSSGTARSLSRWRSTPKCPRLLPVMLCTNWGSGWTRRARDPLLHFAAAPRSTRVVPGIEQTPDLGGAKGTRTPGLLDANQTLFQLSYSPGCLATRVPGARWSARVPDEDELSRRQERRPAMAIRQQSAVRKSGQGAGWPELCPPTAT